MIDVEQDCTISVEWFRENFFTLNADKFHIIMSGHKEHAMYAPVGDALIWEENSKKLLGLFINSKINFRYKCYMQTSD